MVKLYRVSEIILKVGRVPPESKLTTCGSLYPNRGRKPPGNLRGPAKTHQNDAAPVSTKGN